MNDWKEQLKNIKIEKNEKKEDLRYIDTHAHYNANQFKNIRNNLMKELREDLKYIITLGTNMKSNTETLILLSQFDFLYGMIGFFPSDTWELEKDLCPKDVNVYIKDAESNLDIFKHQLINQKIVGIGEIGLDYHWNCVGPRGKEIRGQKARDIQEKWFRYQMDLAKELNLPVSMHSRDAEDDTLRIFNDYNEIKGVMHCFSYGLKSADVYLNKGLYLGIGGTSTYPSNKELREVIKKCPLDRILLETDAPYLSPQQVRREINTSKNIKYVIENISEIKGIGIEEVILKTNENAKKLFNLK